VDVCRGKEEEAKENNGEEVGDIGFCPEAGPPWLIVRFRLNPSVHKSGPLSVPRRRLRW